MSSEDEKEKKSRRDWATWVAAVALLGAAYIGADATRDTQTQFVQQLRKDAEQQRKDADREELRDVLDEAAIAVDEATNETERVVVQWEAIGRAVRGTPVRLRADILRSGRAATRLSLRLGGESNEFLHYTAAADAINESYRLVQKSDPTVATRAIAQRFEAKMPASIAAFLKAGRARLEN